MGDRVSVLATYFDNPKDSISWSSITFGDGNRSARCSGISKKITGSKDQKRVHVLWALDQKITEVHFKDLELSPG